MKMMPSKRPLKPVAVDSKFDGIGALAASLNDIHYKMAVAYSPIVQGIIRDRSQDVQEIEHTLDHLLSCACHPEGLLLFKTLCRYYYTLNSVATADYINCYREMWDTEELPTKEGENDE